MCFFLQLVSTQLVLVTTSLNPRPPPFFVLQFSFSIIHGSRYYNERKPKNKRGRPGNEARSTHNTHADARACAYTHTHTCTKAGMSDTGGMTSKRESSVQNGVGQSFKGRLDQASRHLTSPFCITMCETVIQSGSFVSVI